MIIYYNNSYANYAPFAHSGVITPAPVWTKPLKISDDPTPVKR